MLYPVSVLSKVSKVHGKVDDPSDIRFVDSHSSRNEISFDHSCAGNSGRTKLGSLQQSGGCFQTLTVTTPPKHEEMRIVEHSTQSARHQIPNTIEITIPKAVVATKHFMFPLIKSLWILIQSLLRWLARFVSSMIPLVSYWSLCIARSWGFRMQLEIAKKQRSLSAFGERPAW